ncbi:MAG: phage tail tape measure protein [Gemmiger sp.]|uniref:phage tail tape measure protein n=1 Tax=Gemmiger sp. TaxID=2049027 RepID=UPI002062766A|nr:MAG TPA: tail tape measure protein [Caudoviricetes sp.]
MASKTELAKAYVEIIPSATGIGGKISEALGGEVTAAGATAGQSLGKSLIGAVGKILAAAGIGKMLQAAFTEGSAFETEVAKVGTIADTTKVPIGELKEQISNLSGTMGIAAGDLAEATYQAISAGQDTGDAVAFAGQAAKLAAAGFTSSSSAVDILTTALNAYGLGADKATHVSDVLLTTQNLGKTSVDELSASMGRVIPLAAAYKVNVENLSSGLAIMTANGIATAEATTYTKSMLNELGDTGSTVGKILQKETGQGFAELMDNGHSLGDVLQVLYDSVGGDATKFAALWSSVEAGTGALSLANSGAEKFNDVLAQMENSSGATETAYTTMTDTMAHRMESLKTNAANLGIALFDSVSGKLGAAVSLASGYLQTLTDGFTSGGFAGLAEGLGSVFTDLTTNVGPQLLQSGIDLMTQLGQGMVTGIPQLLAQALPIAADLASRLRANAGQLVDTGIQFILNMAQGLINGLPTMITYIPGIVTDIAGIVNDNAPKLLEAGVKLIIMLGQGLIQAVPTLVANIPQILLAVANVITAFNWIELGGSVIKLLGSGIQGMGGVLKSGFTSVMQGGISYIKSLPAKFIGWGKDMIMGLVKGITGSIGAVVGAVKNVASAIASYMHFSRPDIGPLRMYEQWMPDFMAGLSRGITDNLWMVEDAAERLSGATAEPMQVAVAGTLRSNNRFGNTADTWQPSGMTVNLNNEFHTHDSLSESELTREAESMAQRLKWAIP